MAEEPQLASGSDSDDDDYIPEGVAAQLSEEESGSGSDNEGEEGTKRKKGKSSRKRAKKTKVEETDVKEEVKEESPEELKKKSDALWADFLKDVPCKKTNEDEPRVSAPSDKTDNSNSDEKVTLTQVYEFAGEKVKVEREVPVKPVQTSTRGRGRGRGGGISSILGQLGKKGKLSVLEKSKLDWDKFKAEEGINEEIKTHNRGKNGYLERQDFLQRADLRQFEIEKSLRASKRSLL